MERTIEMKKVVEEQEIWNEGEKAIKFEEKAKKLVSLRFHKQIHIFGKKVSKRMPIKIKKIWDHVIDLKEEFVLRKEKIYLLFREERGEMYKFVEE